MTAKKKRIASIGGGHCSIQIRAKKRRAASRDSGRYRRRGFASLSVSGSTGSEIRWPRNDEGEAPLAIHDDRGGSSSSRCNGPQHAEHEPRHALCRLGRPEARPSPCRRRRRSTWHRASRSSRSALPGSAISIAFTNASSSSRGAARGAPHARAAARWRTRRRARLTICRHARLALVESSSRCPSSRTRTPRAAGTPRAPPERGARAPRERPGTGRTRARWLRPPAGASLDERLGQPRPDVRFAPARRWAADRGTAASTTRARVRPRYSCSRARAMPPQKSILDQSSASATNPSIR